MLRHRKKWGVQIVICNAINTIGLYGCALTCAAMCVKQTVATVFNAGFNKELCDWAGIATKYNKKHTSYSKTYGDIVGLLARGYPVIVKVGSVSKPHWVVVYHFSGEETNPKAGNFTCYCPTNGSVILTNALRYSATDCPASVLTIA